MAYTLTEIVGNEKQYCAKSFVIDGVPLQLCGNLQKDCAYRGSMVTIAASPKNRQECECSYVEGNKK